MPYTGPVNNARKSCNPTSRTGCSATGIDRRATAEASTVFSSNSRLLDISSTSSSSVPTGSPPAAARRTRTA
jgi:hypothetical protein